eukprot:2239558-Lingulodinium_polyedra.AAC.1
MSRRRGGPRAGSRPTAPCFEAIHMGEYVQPVTTEHLAPLRWGSSSRARGGRPRRSTFWRTGSFWP